MHGEWDAQPPLSIGAACLIHPTRYWRKCTLGCQVLRGRTGLSRSLHLQAGCNLLTLSLFPFLSFVSWKEKGVGEGRGRRLKEWKICFKVLQCTTICKLFLFFWNSVLFWFLKEAVAFNVECLEHDLRYEYLTEYHYQHCKLYTFYHKCFAPSFFILLTKMNVISFKSITEEES